MVKELYQTVLRETSLNVTNGEIDSVRKKSITKSGCRVYDGGFLGVAGTLGEPTAESWTQAEANLARKIPCPWGPKTDARRTCRRGAAMDADRFLHLCEDLTETLRREFPQFIFSNKINWTEEMQRLRNDAGLDFTWQDAAGLVSLLVRTQDSVNIFDTSIGGIYRSFDPAAVLQEAREVLEAHLNPISLPDVEKMPVLGSPDMFSRAWSEALNGQKLARQASVWSGEVGRQLFAPDFTLEVDRSADSFFVPFFDAEGTCLEGDTLPLIEGGVLRRGYADRKCAWEQQMQPTAAADGAYDDAPALSLPPLSVRPTGKTLEEILDGRPALYVLTSGGDVTPDGSFATPVQMAYLYQNGRLIGRLPEFGLRGNLTELLGKGFLGCSQDKPYDSSHACVMEMTIVR